MHETAVFILPNHIVFSCKNTHRTNNDRKNSNNNNNKYREKKIEFYCAVYADGFQQTRLSS